MSYVVDKISDFNNYHEMHKGTLTAQKLMIHTLVMDILKMILKQWNTLVELIHHFKLGHVHLAWTHPHVNFC